MNLYDINKSFYADVPAIKDIDNIRKTIRGYLQAHPAKYYLLLNNELHYYTIYTFSAAYRFKAMAVDIADLITDLGEIVDLVTNEDNGMLEIWIRKDDEVNMYGLFDYTRGVIEI